LRCVELLDVPICPTASPGTPNSSSTRRIRRSSFAESALRRDFLNVRYCSLKVSICRFVAATDRPVIVWECESVVIMYFSTQTQKIIIFFCCGASPSLYIYILYIYKYTYICMYMYMYICIYVVMYTCIYAYMCTVERVGVELYIGR
jgi:hypothetical protein